VTIDVTKEIIRHVVLVKFLRTKQSYLSCFLQRDELFKALWYIVEGTSQGLDGLPCESY
jgi:hypothetical protein